MVDRQPGTRVDGKINAEFITKTHFSLSTVVSQMTLVGPPIVFNCGGATYNSSGNVCRKTIVVR